ncbi:conserved exported hypothetical protein [Hyphomicrobiales bacterium]|jgi:hypothetical protein|nr:conserved exported hypothetical protein [Hyphomicrobiales bacterium]CAH1702473.1 conserved exported hypothetical protein [Hyphomicrobiales bacterium]CAI0346673.1 conserved exported hypothetical protein [Hyphomicrobiales bacterium]
MRCALVFLLGILSSAALAQSSGNTPQSRTDYNPRYSSGNSSVGTYSNQNTSGGYSTGGSGQYIPDNSRGSTVNSSGGVMYEYRFK